MAALCDLLLAFGMTFSGYCQPASPEVDPLPQDDSSAWSFQIPKPPPPPPPPPVAAPPVFPPVIIQREVVVREIPVEVPAPPVLSIEEPKPGPMELAVRASYEKRGGALPNWGNVVQPVPASRKNERSTVRPLDLASVVRTMQPEYDEKSITSSLPVDNSRMVTTDRYISVIAETGINTQLDGSNGGPVVLQVSRDVFGYHGRNILIPKGSRLVCGYKPLDKVGSSRAPLRCSRILLGGHRAEIYGMRANATDMQGLLGVSGEVDNRFWERYGTAFILTGISTAVRMAAAESSQSELLANRSDSFQTGGEELSQRLGEITASALEQTINLTPILRIAQGTRLQIRPDTDWYIAKIEEQETLQ